MKKLLTLAAALALFSTGAHAQFAGGTQAPAGGFKGPGLSVSTVAQALDMHDDSPVVLQGSIQQNLGDEKYLFKDATGTVVADIDNKYWAFTSSEEYKEFMEKTEIDVKSLRIVK